MPVLTPTKATGGTVKANPVTYAEADRLVTDDTLEAALSLPGSLNVAFAVDLLSAFLSHERCGRHLYRSVAGRTNNPLLQQRYEHFGSETGRHAEILEELITFAGGNPSYVSPMARAVEATDSKMLESTFLLAGSLDPMTAETAMLDAVFVAESVDQANWQAMRQLAGELPEGEARDRFDDAVSEVLDQEEEHLTWAHETRAKLTMLQVKSSAMAKAGQKAEEAVAAVRQWFS